MPTYLCPRCSFTTSQRANFKRHLTRKNICIPVNSDTPIKSIAKSYGINISSTENNSDINSNIFSNTSNQQIQTNCLAQTHTNLKCKYCNKRFNSTNSCYRHQKHYCKYKKKEITITQDEIEKIKQSVKEEVQKEAELKIKEAELKIKEA